MKRKTPPNADPRSLCHAAALAHELAHLLARLYASEKPATPTRPGHGLTLRQMAVLDGIMTNEPAKAIAARLAISPSTLREHMKAAARRLNVPPLRFTLARAYTARGSAPVQNDTSKCTGGRNPGPLG